MTHRTAARPAQLARHAEALLNCIAGVVSCSVTPSGADAIGRVDVVVSPDAPNAMDRTVTTALLAWLRVEVAADAVHLTRSGPPASPSEASPRPRLEVMQGGDGRSEDDEAAHASPAHDARPDGLSLPARPPRLGAVEFVRSGERDSLCRVTVAWDGHWLTGSSPVAGLPRDDVATTTAAANAVLEAVRSATGHAAGPWALDGVQPVSVGRELCMVSSVRLMRGDDVVHFPAIAQITETPARAAAVATLRAVTGALAAAERAWQPDRPVHDFDS